MISGDQLPGQPIPKKTLHNSQQKQAFELGPYLLAIVAVALALGAAELVNYWIGVENVDLVFLTAIVGIAVRFGLLPSLFASVVSALGYNFFFCRRSILSRLRIRTTSRRSRCLRWWPSLFLMLRRAAACKR